MVDMIIVTGPGFHTELARYPVRAREFQEFVRAARLARKRGPRRAGDGESPMIDVSQTEAEAYCEWCGGYRLPKMAELQALVEGMGAGESDPEVWSQANWRSAAIIDGLKTRYLCEWSCEKEVIERSDGAVRVLGSIFYPPWLREGPSHTHAQAHLLATETYSFVTFRIARSL